MRITASPLTSIGRLAGLAIGCGVVAAGLHAVDTHAVERVTTAPRGSASQPAEPLRGGQGTLLLSGFNGRLFFIDEATEQVETELATRQAIWLGSYLSDDRTRLYLRDATFEHLEVVDLRSRAILDSFTLSDETRRVRIRGFGVDPTHRYAVFLIHTAAKQSDRFAIEEPTLVKYDLQAREVTHEVPWPHGRGRIDVNLLFSPDGTLVYFFSDAVIALETERLTEVDRWELSRPLETGLGPLSFEFARDAINEEPGFFTGLFTLQDPTQARDLMGIGRFDLANRDVDLFTIGPARTISFALAPDRTRAYGILDEIGHYEFWTFDLVARRVENRAVFAGRPRMALAVSSNGQILYVYQAGNTIDLYEAATYRYLRTITLDGDMSGPLFVLPPE